MSLFESLVAIVILGLTAAGFLGAFHATSQSTRNAVDWVQAVGWAESAMEQTRLGPDGAGSPIAETLPPGMSRSVERAPWSGMPGIEQVTVTVTLPGGGAFVLRRLQRAP